jgi:mutator protein MutT
MKRLDVVIAVIHDSGKVLICQRRQDDSFGGYWEFPGGKLERGETPTQCLARELREELAIEVSPTETFPPIEHDYTTARVRLLPYLCTLTHGHPRPLAAQRLEWIEPPRLRDYRFPSANAVLIEQIITRLAGPQSAAPSLPATIDFTPHPS